MINFLNNWVEQIVITVIIVSIFELILPNGNLKKYIKIVLGIYIIFCLISPFINNTTLYDLGNIDLENYIENTTQNETTINQESIDKRLQELYLEELEKDIEKKVEENGYKLYKCDIDADLNNTSKNPGIHKINLTLTENQSQIEKIEIGVSKTDDLQVKTNTENISKLKEQLATEYEINQDIIQIKIR